MAKLGFGPFANRLRVRPPGRFHHHEAIHECVIDWPLQAGPLGQAGKLKPAHEPPLAKRLDKTGFPRTVGTYPVAAQFLAVDDHRRAAVGSEWTCAGWHRQNEARDVERADLDVPVADQASLDARRHPVLVEPVDLHPCLPIVTQRTGDESHLARYCVPTPSDDRVDAFVNLRLGCGMILVPGFRADDVPQRQPLPGKESFHDAGGLNLFVVFTAVRDGGCVEKITGVQRGVVKPPKRAFVLRRKRALF